MHCGQGTGRVRLNESMSILLIGSLVPGCFLIPFCLQGKAASLQTVRSVLVQPKQEES